MYTLNNNRNEKKYFELFKQYVKGTTMNKYEWTIELTKFEYTTERFLILALCNGSSFVNDASVIVCYDFKTMLGMITCDMSNKSVKI